MARGSEPTDQSCTSRYACEDVCTQMCALTHFWIPTENHTKKKQDIAQIVVDMSYLTEADTFFASDFCASCLCQLSAAILLRRVMYVRALPLNSVEQVWLCLAILLHQNAKIHDVLLSAFVKSFSNAELRIIFSNSTALSELQSKS